MKQKPIPREELSEMFRLGAIRKMEEHEIFAVRQAEQPERSVLFAELLTYTDIEWRYYDLAQHYYADDMEYFENGLNEDLLLLTKTSELPPKLYAEYLREISPSARASEKITHSHLVALKKSITKVRDELR